MNTASSSPMNFYLPDLLLEEGFKPLGLLADAMPQLVWIARPGGEVVYYSSRLGEFAGATRNASGSWNWQGLLHPEDYEATGKAWSEAIATGGIYEKEHRVQMRDGTFRWHLSRAFPQKNERGEVLNWFGTATDIHEQKLVAEKIKGAEERWRTALEATQIGTWEYNPFTKTFFLSDVARAIRGLGTDVQHHFTINRESIHPKDLQYVEEAMQAAISGGKEEPFSMEYRVYKKSHEQWCWIRSIGRLILDEENQPQRIIGILQDITEQKQAEEKLQYLATLTQNIADAVVGTDIDHTIINWNKGAEKIYGWTKEEVLGKKAKDILQTQFLSASDEQTWLQAYNEKGQWQGEVLQKRKDGQILSILASIAKVTDNNGKHIGGVGVNKDITQQHKAAQLLKESEERFRILTNTIPQIVWINGADGTLEFLNDQWYKITGQTTEEGLANRLKMMHPDDVPLLQEKWRQAFVDSNPFSIEYRLNYAPTGQYRWFFGNIQPLKDQDGNVVKWIGASTDIQHFKDISVVLEQQVQERTRELNRLNAALQKQTEELRRSNEDLQQFAHVASHDLKEPLRKIKTYGSRLNDEFGDILPGKAKLFLEKMDSAATRMSSMIDGVLGYSMLGATEQIIEEVDLNLVLQQIESDLEISIHQKGAAIHYGQLPVLDGSAILIYQLFYNLINNSLKFSRNNVLPFIRITAVTIHNAHQLHEALLPGKEYVQIKLEDNGIGFEQQHAEKIFRTFTRLNAKDKYEGTGLGLSLCQKIVQRHNGMIRADGVMNEGASFTILLPLQQS